MKVFLHSILLAFVLICLWLSIATVFVVTNNFDVAKVPFVDLPLRLPKIIFFYFSPPTPQDYMTGFSIRKLVFGLCVFFGNLFLYATPIYLLLLFFKRTKTEQIRNEIPPPPPTFE
jgi:ABC-type Na+ efflux pump permease subunit